MHFVRNSRGKIQCFEQQKFEGANYRKLSI